MRTAKQHAANMISIKKAQATTPWRKQVYPTKRAARIAKYLYNLDEPHRPRPECDEM